MARVDIFDPWDMATETSEHLLDDDEPGFEPIMDCSDLILP